jgi:hypothetical protein
MKQVILLAVCMLVVAPSWGWAGSVTLQPAATKGVAVSLGASEVHAFTFAIPAAVRSGRITRAVFRCEHECGVDADATYLVHESPVDYANLDTAAWQENADAMDAKGPWQVETLANGTTLIADVQHLLRDGRATLTLVVEQRVGECDDIDGIKAGQATLHIAYR